MMESIALVEPTVENESFLNSKKGAATPAAPNSWLPLRFKSRTRYFAFLVACALVVVASLWILVSHMIFLLDNSAIPDASTASILIRARNKNGTVEITHPWIVQNDFIISTLQTREHPNLAFLFGNKESYCRAHDYSFAPSFSIHPGINRHPAWSKLVNIRDLIHSTERRRPVLFNQTVVGSEFERNYGRWILMSDFDVIIMNQKLKIEDHILEPVKKQRLAKSGKTMDDLMLILTTDCNGLNTGNSLWRNSPETSELINILWENNVDDVHNIRVWWEQAALGDLIQMSADARSLPDPVYQEKYSGRREIVRAYAKRVDLNARIEFVEQSRMNAYPSIGCGSKFGPGDFLVHFPGGFKGQLEYFIHKLTNKQ